MPPEYITTYGVAKITHVGMMLEQNLNEMKELAKEWS